MTAVTNDRDLDPAMVEAVDWVVRLSSGVATDEDVRALEAWRAESPAHDAAFRRMAGLRPVARALKATPRLDRRTVLASGGALVAATATLGLAHPPLGLWPSFAEMMADYRTRPGERLALAPANGVRIELNSRTSASLIDGDTGLALIDGEAYLSVARTDAFTVQAEATQIVAHHAVFNVQAFDDEVRIACISGSIACSSGDNRATAGPREQLLISVDSSIARSTTTVAQAIGWLRGQLVFDNTPLADVVRQINRYRSGRIMITNDRIGRRLVSGVFYTDQMEPAVMQLQQLLNLNLRRLPGGVVLLG